MAHLVNSGMRHDLGEIPAPSAQTKNVNGGDCLDQITLTSVDVRNPAEGSASDVKIDFFRKREQSLPSRKGPSS